MFKPWMRLAVDATLLGIEAQTVIGIRLSRIALGRGSAAETQLMVSCARSWRRPRRWRQADLLTRWSKAIEGESAQTSGALADRAARNLSGHGPLTICCNAAS